MSSYTKIIFVNKSKRNKENNNCKKKIIQFESCKTTTLGSRNAKTEWLIYLFINCTFFNYLALYRLLKYKFQFILFIISRTHIAFKQWILEIPSTSHMILLLKSRILDQQLLHMQSVVSSRRVFSCWGL